MTDIKQDIRLELLKLSTEIVASQVSGQISSEKSVDTLLKNAFDALSRMYHADDDHQKDRPDPAVPIDESVQEDYIVCLEDGKKMKMMRRHLMTAYNMTPEEYRERWGLPADYPMTAPSYSKRRSGLAKEIGLGKNRRKN